jgi:hypothetical protein
MPLTSNEQNKKPLATCILCIHHNDYESLPTDFKTKFQEILTTHLEIQTTYTNNSNITPNNIKINTSTQWTNTNTYIKNNLDSKASLEQPICPKFDIPPQLKFPTNSYYTNGSYIPPKSLELETLSDIVGYGIYNKEKILN